MLKKTALFLKDGFPNAASHENFFLFQVLNLDGKGENRFKTRGSMVNLKDNLVGKNCENGKLESSKY